MAPRIKYAVFGAGMVALVLGIAVSLWIIVAAVNGTDEAGRATVGTDAPSLAQTLEQALGLSPEQASALAGQLQSAAAKTPGDDDSGAALAPTLQAALGLTEEQAADLSARLQAAVTKAQAAPAGGETPKGTIEEASIGDQVEFVVRDAAGKVKQTGSGK